MLGSLTTELGCTQNEGPKKSRTSSLSGMVIATYCRGGEPTILFPYLFKFYFLANYSS